jgi:cytochrome oxidase Cu insertion factor (SCO1/SenC/PrrC family)
MFNEERNYNLDRDVSFVFITIDPSAGNARSLYVLLSMFYPDTKSGHKTCVVCYLNQYKPYSIHSWVA